MPKPVWSFAYRCSGLARRRTLQSAYELSSKGILDARRTWPRRLRHIHRAAGHSRFDRFATHGYANLDARALPGNRLQRHLAACKMHTLAHADEPETARGRPAQEATARIGDVETQRTISVRESDLRDRRDAVLHDIAKCFLRHAEQT